MTQSRMMFRDLWRFSQCVNSQFSKNNVGGYLYVKFKCIYYNKLDSHLKTASVGIRKIQHVNKGCECPAEILLSWNSSFKAYFIKKYCFLSLYCFFYYLFFTCFITITNVCLFNFELPLIFLKLLNKLTTIKSILSISLIGN